MHPALEVIDRLIEERELASKASGVYSYPYGEGMMYQCTSCAGKCRDDDCGVVHEEGCPTKEYEEFERANNEQLQSLRQFVLDSVQIRRMLCTALSDKAYMDDGAASDATELPHIDYLRDSAKDIVEKWRQRLINRSGSGL